MFLLSLSPFSLIPPLTRTSCPLALSPPTPMSSIAPSALLTFLLPFHITTNDVISGASAHTGTIMRECTGACELLCTVIQCVMIFGHGYKNPMLLHCTIRSLTHSFVRYSVKLFFGLVTLSPLALVLSLCTVRNNIDRAQVFFSQVTCE